MLELMEIQALSNAIMTQMKGLEKNKDKLEIYYKSQINNLANKLQINHFSIMISFLQNSNLKILDLMRLEFSLDIINQRLNGKKNNKPKETNIWSFIFELFYNNKDYFDLVNYKPNKLNFLLELENLISQKSKDNKDKSEKELKRLRKLTKMMKQ